MDVVTKEAVRLAVGNADRVDAMPFAVRKRKAVVGRRPAPDNGFYARRLEALSNQ